jgi:hypothetical protein
VDNAAAMVSEHDEDEQDPQARGGHSEEITGDEIADVIGEKVEMFSGSEPTDQALARRMGLLRK